MRVITLLSNVLSSLLLILIYGLHKMYRHGQVLYRKVKSVITPYLFSNFTLVKNSVQITAICDLFSIHRSYNVT